MIRSAFVALAALGVSALLPSLPAEETPAPPIVNFRALLSLIPPALPGWTAAKPEGNTTKMGAFELTQVSCEYTKGDSRASLQIMDYALNREMMKGLMLAWQFSNESTDGYQKSITLDGVPGFETWEESSKTTSVFLAVADRYWVHVEVTGEAAGVAREILKKLDLKALGAVK